MIEIIYDLIFPSYARGSYFTYFGIVLFIAFILMNAGYFIYKKIGKTATALIVTAIVAAIWISIPSFPDDKKLFGDDAEWSYSKGKKSYLYKSKKIDGLKIIYDHLNDYKGFLPSQNEVLNCKSSERCRKFIKTYNDVGIKISKVTTLEGNNINCFISTDEEKLNFFCPNEKKGLYALSVFTSGNSASDIRLAVEKIKTFKPIKWID